MQIDEALRDVPTLERTQSAIDAQWIQYDSRRIQPGDIFVAMAGGTTDGNKFIDSALQRGAAAIVTDSREVWETHSRHTAPFYLVPNGRRALATIAANLLDHPERKLAVSAVTGTNGKTTTAWLLEQLLRSVGRKTVLLGTIETHIAGEVRPSEHTTPEASDLLKIFADGVAAGATEAVMEMSSHALDQERVYGIPVDVAIFTNLTQDHLDYHGTMEQYFKAKAKLFKGVGAAPPRVAVLNEEDYYGCRIARECSRSEVMMYDTDDYGNYRAENVELALGDTRFTFATPGGRIALRSPLSGRVNVLNLLAASCAAMARGMSLEQIATAVERLRQAPGRLQIVPGSADSGITVVVDYAHTDDALKNLIALGRELAGSGRLITLFGCGGDRDRTKRPKMGRAAAEQSDLVVLTSDNPRSEDPIAIIEEALIGVRETATPCIVEPDRAAAIALAIRAAHPGDIVLLAGKGHEKVQILRDRTLPFDDVEVAARVLALS